MVTNAVGVFMFHFLIAIHIQISHQLPIEEDAKAAYKSGEVPDQGVPITLDRIKTKLRESEVFDFRDAALSDRERKELQRLFDAVEIMTTSRNRQPQSAQNMFSALRLVERAVKKQVKEGQISEALAGKFHWERISGRHRRENKLYRLDTDTNMRIFNLAS